MKEYTEQQVQDLVKLKFGALVDSANNTSFVSNALLGKLFRCSASKARRLYLEYFADLARKKQPLLQRL